MIAFTLGFHIVLVPFGVAFTFITLIANYRALRLGDADALVLARRWSQWPRCCSRWERCPAPSSPSRWGFCGPVS
jgi:hypothetical protein